MSGIVFEAHQDDLEEAGVARFEPAYGKWQPIETAPKDGTFIILGFFRANPSGSDYECHSEPIVARWLPPLMALLKPAQECHWEARFGRIPSWDCSSSPSHWMPMPMGPN